MHSETIRLNSQATLTTYLWSDSRELAVIRRPAVLVFPGGAYMFCSDREAEPVALGYMAEGFNAFVLRYTTVKQFDPPFQEAQEALRLIRSNADQWHIDPHRVAVCGFSAGGHLACAMGVLAREKPNAMVLGYPAVSKETWRQFAPDIPNLISQVQEDAAPAFLFHTANDEVVPVGDSLRLMNALSDHGVSFEGHIYPTGDHGLSRAKPLCSGGRANMIAPVPAAWFAQSVRWLKEVIGEVEVGEPYDRWKEDPPQQ